MCSCDFLRFVSDADVEIEEFPWGPHEWFVKEGITENEQLLLVKVRMPAGTAHQFHRHPHMEEALSNNRSPKASVLRSVLSSCKIGGVLFHDMAVTMDYDVYIESQWHGIKTLRDNSFDEIEVGKYKTICKMEVSRMINNGQTRFEEKEFTNKFVGRYPRTS